MRGRATRPGRVPRARAHPPQSWGWCVAGVVSGGGGHIDVIILVGVGGGGGTPTTGLRDHGNDTSEHRPQRPTERSDPTRHAKGRTGDCPGPRKETNGGRTPRSPGPNPRRQNIGPRARTHTRRNTHRTRTGPTAGQPTMARRGLQSEERGTVRGPVKKQQNDGMSHGEGGRRTVCYGDSQGFTTTAIAKHLPHPSS